MYNNGKRRAFFVATNAGNDVSSTREEGGSRGTGEREEEKGGRGCRAGSSAGTKESAGTSSGLSQQLLEAVALFNQQVFSSSSSSNNSSRRSSSNNRSSGSRSELGNNARILGSLAPRNQNQLPATHNNHNRHQILFRGLGSSSSQLCRQERGLNDSNRCPNERPLPASPWRQQQQHQKEQRSSSSKYLLGPLGFRSQLVR